MAPALEPPIERQEEEDAAQVQCPHRPVVKYWGRHMKDPILCSPCLGAMRCFAAVLRAVVDSIRTSKTHHACASEAYYSSTQGVL